MSSAAAVERALAAVDGERVAQLCAGLVDIASPTGDERPLAEWIVGKLRSVGVPTRLQPIDDQQANAVAELGSPGRGPDLLLYAPIDTLTVGDADADVPWIGAELADHARPQAQRRAGRVVGLGAQNPKGHAACIMAALEALTVSGIAAELNGRLLGGFGAGGMPTTAIGERTMGAGDEATHGRRNTGHGVGASFLLERGIWPDAAVIAKSGWAVSAAEVGLAWIDVTVGGVHNYVGARHRIAYRNAIVAAGTVAAFLDDWFVEYSARHASGEVAPQGVVAAIRAGWWRMAAVVPAVARLRVDVRIAPGDSPLDVWREVDAALDVLRHGDESLDITTELAVAIPGSSTPGDHWIVGETVAAWETVTGADHVAPTATSGATDANILRNRGVPTARVGLPKSFDGDAELDFAAGMNTVDVAALEALTRLLVTLAVNAGTTTREQLAATHRGSR